MQCPKILFYLKNGSEVELRTPKESDVKVLFLI